MISHYKYDIDRIKISFCDGAISHTLRIKSKISKYQLERTFPDVEIEPGAQSHPNQVYKMRN